MSHETGQLSSTGQAGGGKQEGLSKLGEIAFWTVLIHAVTPWEFPYAALSRNEPSEMKLSG